MEGGAAVGYTSSVRALVVSALAFLALPSCAPPPPPVVDGGNPVADAGPTEPPDFLTVLDDEADLTLLAAENGAVKHLLPVAGATPRPPVGDACAFQNTARFPYHLQFIAAQEGGEDVDYATYVQLVLRRATRVWWGGEVAYDPGRLHPLTNEPGVLAWAIYTQDEPGDRLIEDDVRAAYAILVACAPAYADRLAFAPTSTEQRTTAAAIRAALHEDGIAVLAP